MVDLYPLINALEGGIPPALKLFQCILAVLCLAFFVCPVPNFVVCLVSSFRCNGLATLGLAAFGRVRALRARCGPFELAMH